MIIYASSAVKLFSEPELVELLTKARANNRALDITGMLLYKDGNFLQLLEGPEQAVSALVEKIKLDPRHAGFLRLLQRETKEREFRDWEMGFKALDDPTIASKIPGYSDFLNIPFDSEEYRETPSKALKLLLNFKQLMR